MKVPGSRNTYNVPGFVINIEKSVWDPRKDIEWLGFKIDLAKGEFSVPDHELVKLRSQL